MSTVSYQMVSWNIGRDTDYLGVCLRTKEPGWSTVQELYTKRNGLMQKAFQSMVEGVAPDFFCLQEVTRPSQVKQWLGDRYEIASAGRDCVIAWDKSKYTLIENSIREEQQEGRHLLCDLKEKASSKTIRLASVHLWGFNLAEPNQKEAEGGLPTYLKGDLQLKQLLEAVDSNERAPLVALIGIDANTTPTIHTERLEMLEKDGFLRDKTRDAIPTAYNVSTENHAVHLDYILGRSMQSRVIQVAQTHFPIMSIENPSVNPSDHAPVINTITLVTSP